MIVEKLNHFDMKKYCLLLCFLLLCGVVPAQNERVVQLDKEAFELYKQEKYQDALVKYDQLLELVKDNYKLYYFRSYCNLMLKRYITLLNPPKPRIRKQCSEGNR